MVYEEGLCAIVCGHGATRQSEVCCLY